MIARRPRVHIVVTCANRKRLPVPAALQLRRTTGVRPGPRAARWLLRLSADGVDAVPAEHLYAGEHWDIARSLPGLATGFSRATLWIASAGWGLIPTHAPVRSYSATFTPRHPDSVAADARGTQIWWDTLSGWQGPTPGSPRSLAALIAEYPRDRVLVVLSQTYLAACDTDLQAALNLARPGQVSIVVAGAGKRPDLAGWQLPADARLQHIVGGTRGALNARITADLLAAGLTGHDAMHDRLQRHLASAPPLTVYTRQRLTDDAVVEFIHARRADDPLLSCNRLLRELRDAGMACEQKRFGQLFATAVGNAS